MFHKLFMSDHGCVSNRSFDALRGSFLDAETVHTEHLNNERRVVISQRSAKMSNSKTYSNKYDISLSVRVVLPTLEDGGCDVSGEREGLRG